jgi:hypothetical protein
MIFWQSESISLFGTAGLLEKESLIAIYRRWLTIKKESKEKRGGNIGGGGSQTSQPHQAPQTPLFSWVNDAITHSLSYKGSCNLVTPLSNGITKVSSKSFPSENCQPTAGTATTSIHPLRPPPLGTSTSSSSKSSAVSYLSCPSADPSPLLLQGETKGLARSTLLPFRFAMAIVLEGYCHFSVKTPSIGVGRSR